MPEDPSYVPEDPSRVLAGRYRLLTPLGAGGMGVVWRARDELLHQTVAVKEVTLPVRLTPEDRERRLRRTLREARTAATLRGHPGIVTVYDVVEEDDRPWIVMELVEGPSLAKVIKDEGRLAEARAAWIGLRVISALVSAEAAGIVHRDVKPANILLAGDRVMLTDFGIAAAVHDTTDLTDTGQLLGTIPYLAPEQLDSARASAACDLWSVGVTLYEAVEGRRPFDRDSPVATIAAILNQPPLPTRYANRLLPVIEGLLEKDPAERLTAERAASLLTPVATGAPEEHPRPAGDPGTAGDAGRGRGALSGVSDLPPPVDRARGASSGVSDRPLPVNRVRRASSGVSDPMPPMDRVRTGDPRRPSPRVPMAVAAGCVLLAAAVAAVVIWSPDTLGLGSPPTTTPGGSATASADPGERSTASGEPSRDLTASPGRDPLPPGFTLHTDRRGFSIAVPDGWTKGEDKDPDQVDWQRPRDSVLSPSSWYLGVFADPKRKETRKPEDILDQLRDALQDEMFAPGSYRELARRAVPVAGGRGAELEFGFAHRSASNLPHRLYARCVIRDSGGAGMFWFFTPAGQWAEAGRHVETFKDTFRLD
ncbi:protein kinase [Streptosporangium sp. NPDC002721]|uniref:serine/threonine-protein kinase n=1 Tax=Streptosporangium sp. NPDC002721 TaxID=3366188 RepID=UPI0036C4067B